MKVGQKVRPDTKCSRRLEDFLKLPSKASTNLGACHSGGPLIDDLRAVVAISTAGFAPGGGQVCQNFFVPIGEALIVMGQSIKEALKASVFKDFGSGSSKI